MARINLGIILLSILALFVVACSDSGQTTETDYTNPFLDETSGGKEDTGYVNVRGVEVHVSIEADVEAPSYDKFESPPYLAQFGMTYLKNKNKFYIELLAEDTTAEDRVEWLVDGQWLSKEEAENVDSSLLTHFRLQEINAVVLNSASNTIEAGATYQAKVPLAPYNIMADADDKCAKYDSHIDLSQSVYWYLWKPDKSECPQELLQTMTVTVSEVLEKNPESYPEYDQLWEDNKLTAAVFFAKLDDGDVEDDYNWRTFDSFCNWLREGDFQEVAEAPMGKRFTRQKGDLVVEIDVYGPDVFHSVADYSRFANWQRAVSEHEIVMYNGHSVLGTGYAFEEVNYPDFYQVFQVASCLSYEYYVRPVLAGKNGWDDVDVISNVEPTYYSENLPLTSTVLAKLVWGFENNGQASWQDIMEAVSRKMNHSRFGVSGARGNCYSPAGDKCGSGGPDPTKLRYENVQEVEIPDNDSNGITSTIEVTDDAEITALSVELNINHSYIGDLYITLSHGDTEHVIWNKTGGTTDNIYATFDTGDFDGQNALGTWSLNISDNANIDTGSLVKWTLIVTPKQAPPPDPEEHRYDNTESQLIPDNDETGITSTITVPDDITISSLSLELNVTHSYTGDLIITLSHNGSDHIIWNKKGGNSQNIYTTFEVDTFNDSNAAGDWTLHIEDTFARDEGNLDNWTLIIKSPPN
jgi:subtilisin-like proprotein convertase family protein